MKLHGNARTCPHTRRLIVRRVEEERWTLAAAAEAAGVSVRTVSKWLACYRAEGEDGLLDRSSAPRSIPHRTSEERVQAIAALRRLGVRAHLRRRRDPARLRRGARRRESDNCSRLLAPRGRPLPRLRDPRRAGDDRQRLLLPRRHPHARLPSAPDQAPAHPAVPAAHQRQGRALHPHHARRLGLRRDLRQLRRTTASTRWLAQLLQSTTTTRLPRPPTTTTAVGGAHQEQRGWVLHLDRSTAGSLS